MWVYFQILAYNQISGYIEFNNLRVFYNLILFPQNSYLRLDTLILYTMWKCNSKLVFMEFYQHWHLSSLIAGIVFYATSMLINGVIPYKMMMLPKILKWSLLSHAYELDELIISYQQIYLLYYTSWKNRKKYISSFNGQHFIFCWSKWLDKYDSNMTPFDNE